VLTVITASMAGYALSRRRFRGKAFFYAAILAGIMIPPQALIVPLFREFQTAHLINTYWALVLPQVPAPIAVFIIKKFFDGIPISLEQAAEVDGAGWWTAYRRIALPLARPAIAAVSIFTFVWTWNNFLWPFLAATSQTMTHPGRHRHGGQRRGNHQCPADGLGGARRPAAGLRVPAGAAADRRRRGRHWFEVAGRRPPAASIASALDPDRR
jgi:ABC-type glycerol-3-phosphate transport system permease component